MLLRMRSRSSLIKRPHGEGARLRVSNRDATVEAAIIRANRKTHYQKSSANTWIWNRFHPRSRSLIQRSRKPHSFIQPFVRDGARKLCTKATNRHATGLMLLREREQACGSTGAQFGSGSDGNDGVDRHSCRSSSCCPSQSRAPVHLHRRIRGLAQRPCPGHRHRRHRGDLRCIVFPQPSCCTRLCHL